MGIEKRRSLPMPTASAKPIRVLIADDHCFFRQTLRKIFDAAEDLEVVGESENGSMAVTMAGTLKPDVIIMDARMPIMDGIVATGRIVTANPVTRVVILTLAEMEDDLYEAVQAGARSYLLKESDAHVIVEAVRSVHRGEVVLTPLLLGKLFDSICAQSVGPTPG
jgi:DNA-binding NarL/FixJ family response regulator